MKNNGNLDDLRDTLVAVNDVLLDCSHLSYAARQHLNDFKAELEEQLRMLVAEDEDDLRAA
jgi:hypothetical protein